MKKCNRCKIVFHDDQRQECLYCDTKLLSVEQDDSQGFRDEKDFDPNLIGGGIKREMSILRVMLRDWELQEFLRAQYVVGTYFKIRTLKFLYTFSRNNFKMGNNYTRLLVQPLNITSFLTIPWVMINMLDTIYIRLSYNAYCPTCGWKFHQIHATQVHDAGECEYNREYSRIVKEILSGNINKTEGQIKEYAYKKFKGGIRSAYKDLCSRRNALGAFIDIMCIWISVLIVLTVCVMLIFPHFMKFGSFMTSGE